MDAHARTREVQYCAEAALLPLMNNNREAFAILMADQGSCWRSDERRKRFLEQRENLTPEDMEDLETLRSFRAENRTKMIDKLSAAAGGIGIYNDLTEHLSYGFMRAIALAGSSHIPPMVSRSDLENFSQAIDNTRKAVDAYKNLHAPADLKKPIETALKWLDAARMIATSDQPITAQSAYNLISLQK